MRLRNKTNKILVKSLAFVMAAVFALASAAVPVNAAESSNGVEYSATSGMKRNVLYYGDWSIWGGLGNFYPSGIPADQITHLNFAFLDFNASGELLFTDKDAAVGAPVGMTGVQWGAANAGILSAMQDLRAQNPNLRIGVSIGGWSKSGDFAPVAANAASRAKFIQNVCKFIKYTNMDFVDLDWEYPGSVRTKDTVDNKNDEGTPNSTAADKANFITLLSELKTALNEQGADLGKVYELSVALPATQSQLNLGIDIPSLFQIVDFANIMTYDMRGAWDNISGHQTALYTNPADPYASNGLSVDGSVNYLLSQGAIPEKIVIGCAFYTRGWENVADGGVSGLPGLFGAATQVNKDADQTLSYGALNEAAISSGDGGRCGGVWGYGSLDKLNVKYPGLVEYWDDVAKAPYLYNASIGAFFTYDNVRSVQEKAEYVNANNLGGCISWMAGQDKTTSTGKRDELTKAIKESLFGSAALPNYNISKPAIDVSATVETYTETNASGYQITLRNNAVKNESGDVLSLTEAAAETVKLPKLYIKTGSGSTFATGGYGSGQVTNTNGYGVVDLSTVYDNKTILQGGSVTFKLKVTGTVDVNDIESIELSQRIVESGIEISRQTIYGGSGTVTDQKPVITGADNRTIQTCTVFDALQGVTATDKEDGIITDNIIITGTVDTNTAGTYTLTYSVTDSADQTTTVIRTITVVETITENTKPVITGVADQTITVGDTFDALAGVSAYDAEDGAITDITVTGSVNTAAAGTYTLTYSVTDSAGATTTATCVITVAAVNPPDGNNTYDAAKTYWAGDTVTYNGETYKAKWWVQGGGTPDENPAWEKITNNSGSIAEYSPTKEYVKDDQVTYNGNTYKAKWWTKGDIPGSSSVWELVQ